MSSTNRGYERHKTDFYVTPHQCVRDFFNVWKPDLRSFLDPCAGGDEKHGMTYPEVIKEFYPDAKITTLDIRPDSKADISADYLNHISRREYDCVITNPPFYLAKEIITKALQDICNGGYVIMLLRLNFLGSNERFPFFKDNMPEAIYVHHRRMSFTDDGKTDSIEYAHFVWRKGYESSYSQLYLI